MQRFAISVLAIVFAVQLWARPTALNIPFPSATQPAGAWNETVHFAPVRDRQRSCAIYMPPELISRREPLGAKGANAILNFVITRRGEVNDLVLLNSAGASNNAAANAVSGWRFRPATCDGVPTDSEATLQLRSSF
jgi:TonB family protein